MSKTFPKNKIWRRLFSLLKNIKFLKFVLRIFETVLLYILYRICKESFKLATAIKCKTLKIQSQVVRRWLLGVKFINRFAWILIKSIAYFYHSLKQIIWTTFITFTTFTLKSTWVFLAKRLWHWRWIKKIQNRKRVVLYFITWSTTICDEKVKCKKICHKS